MREFGATNEPNTHLWCGSPLQRAIGYEERKVELDRGVDDPRVRASFMRDGQPSSTRLYIRDEAS